MNGDDGEAILDAEYASAAAPSAAIVMAACANTTTDGLLTAIQNLINGASPPAIISLSYGRVRGVERRRQQCGLQRDLSAGRRGGDLDLRGLGRPGRRGVRWRIDLCQTTASA